MVEGAVLLIDECENADLIILVVEFFLYQCWKVAVAESRQVFNPKTISMSDEESSCHSDVSDVDETKGI